MEITNIEINKGLNEQMRDVLTVISPKLAEKIRECGSFIKQTPKGKNIIYNCCNSRYCCLCTEKKKEHDARLLSATLEQVLHNNLKPVAITISPFNCYNEQELKETKAMLDKAFKRFINYKEIKRVLVGSVRKYEIALNNYATNKSFNLHIHCILVFKSGFYSPKYYVNGNTLKKLFDKALQGSFDYSIKVKHVDCSNYEQIANYITKPVIYIKEKLTKTQLLSAFRILYKATNRVKMYQYSSGLRPYKEQAKQELKNLRDEVDQRECIDYRYSSLSGKYVQCRQAS